MAVGRRSVSAGLAGGVTLSAAAPASTPRAGSNVVISQSLVELSSAECDDAADRVVRGHAHCDAIARHDLDAEAAHPAAELGEHLVSGVTLHAVETATMNRHDRALHVDEIVLTQTASIPFIVLNKHCATKSHQSPVLSHQSKD